MVTRVLMLVIRLVLIGIPSTPSLFPVIKITGNNEGVEYTPLAYTIRSWAGALEPT